MTPEQFVFWLSGYLTGGRDNDDCAIVQDIVDAIKKVNPPSIIEFTEFPKE